MKLALVLAIFLMAVPAFAQPQTARNQQPVVTDDETKVNVYKRFWDNRVPNPAVAYEAAREYMRLYNREDDDYTRYLKVWIASYEEDLRVLRMNAERADREQQLLGSFSEKNYTRAYGLAKQVLADDPNNVRVLIALGYGAVAASTEARNETFNAEAAKHAAKAITLIGSGRTPETWAPFKGKEDVLGSLHYALGFYALKTNPEAAIPSFITATQVDADRRNAPSTYYFLAVAYQNGPYKRLSEDFTKRFGNQPESPESKAALDGVNKVVDKMIDAYARAVALAGTNPQNQAAKSQWMTQLTNFYKFRHNNSDVGLNEFIAGVLAKPLPQ
jgi:tetratricopeptide (TPR) repeat protein